MERIFQIKQKQEKQHCQKRKICPSFDIYSDVATLVYALSMIIQNVLIAIIASCNGTIGLDATRRAKRLLVLRNTHPWKAINLKSSKLDETSQLKITKFLVIPLVLSLTLSNVEHFKEKFDIIKLSISCKLTIIMSRFEAF